MTAETTALANEGADHHAADAVLAQFKPADNPSGPILVEVLEKAANAPKPKIDAGPDAEAYLKEIQAARNPLLHAAMPLLRMLAEMPTELPSGANALDLFRELLEREVAIFQTLCDKASLRREHVLTARYCLCTALDEAAGSTAWGSEGGWAQHSLAQRFHQDVEGGRKFFLLVGRLTQSPQEHLDLLEVMYRILGLGFQGRYATEPDGARELESVRHYLFTLIQGARGPVDPALSRHWQPETEGRLKPLYSLPVRVSFSVLGLIAFAFFAWEKYGLVTETGRLEARIAALAKLAPPRPQLRLAELLKDEIAAGRVAVQDEATRSRVVFRGDDMFLPGQAKVSPRITATLNRLAAEVARVPGKVVVTGHSDGQPIRSAEFPSNLVLSEKRAVAVAAYLAGKGVERDRLETVGKGDGEPVADNQTPAGRAQNRRVEIEVRQ